MNGTATTTETDGNAMEAPVTQLDIATACADGFRRERDWFQILAAKVMGCTVRELPPVPADFK